MKIRYKELMHGKEGLAPFKGAFLVANGWDNKYQNDRIKNYLSLKTKVRNSSELISRIRRNEANEGVIFGGLEWGLQPQELLELIEMASNEGLFIMIYSTYTIDEFMDIIGRAVVDIEKYTEYFEEEASYFQDDSVYQFIGATVIDELIKDRYYMKFGLEDSLLYVVEKEVEDERYPN